MLLIPPGSEVSLKTQALGVWGWVGGLSITIRMFQFQHPYLQSCVFTGLTCFGAKFN